MITKSINTNIIAMSINEKFKLYKLINSNDLNI